MTKGLCGPKAPGADVCLYVCMWAEPSAPSAAKYSLLRAINTNLFGMLCDQPLTQWFLKVGPLLASSTTSLLACSLYEHACRCWLSDGMPQVW